MSKRRPDQQLTQNNWEDELEKDEIGQFQKADENEMKTRVIRKVRRRQQTADGTDLNDSSVKPVSVFSGFSLVSNKSSTIGADAAASVSKPLFSFGTSFSSQQPATTGAAPFSASSSLSVTTSLCGTQRKVDDIKSSEFVKKLNDLNDAVLKCIKVHIESGKACILTPIFKDYENYVKELEDNDKNVSAAKADVGAGAAATFSPSPVKNTSTAAAVKSFTFSFNAPKTLTDTKTESSSLSTASPIETARTQSVSAAPQFSFGKPSTTFGGTSSGFSFSSAIQTSKPTENDNKTEGGTTGNGENAEDEDDEPPKVEFKPVVEEESIYSKRCKVFVKDDGGYKDRGTGTLYLKNVKDDKVQLIVRADTNLGNILLNILLSSAIPAKCLKNNVVLVCIPTPESEQKPRSVLVRVKTEEDAKELLEEIEKHQK